MTALRLEGVSKTYRSIGRPPVQALDRVTLDIEEGKISGLVGESGSGKTTLIRCVMGLETIDAGRIVYRNTVLQPGPGRARHRMRREIQLVFQDPTASLNPRMTVAQLVGEGVYIHHLRRTSRERHARVTELLELVGIDPRDSDRYPRSFSGGQRQRIAIARALAVEPDILVCDEPVSSLDVSVQAQILQLLRDMQTELGLTILFVAHDLAVIQQVCADVAVLADGRIVEQGRTRTVLSNPQHSYTRSLVNAVAVPDPIIARERARQRRRGEARVPDGEEAPPALPKRPFGPRTTSNSI
jgi:oligopeptide transport system ATP-binding protein